MPLSHLKGRLTPATVEEEEDEKKKKKKLIVGDEIKLRGFIAMDNNITEQMPFVF